MSDYVNYFTPKQKERLLECPQCGSRDIWHYDYEISSSGNIDKFKCPHCRIKFSIPWKRYQVYDEEKVCILDEGYECRRDCPSLRLEAAS